MTLCQPAEYILNFRSVVFLLHIALEIPIAVQGLWAGQNLPFLDMNNTSLTILKLYSSLLLASCLAALLVFSLPEFLPGKRAFAMALLLYHSIASTMLFQSPRFIPHSFGPLAEQAKLTPEVLWGACHGIISLGLGIWWQTTIGYSQVLKQE
ncbi:hypothetical protein JB92DRAFT_3084864 [Gautieria morchelliformis]|nr:hypothetical protein JB92DRAFT_3084864 [Gautieria morchelliformis]